ncbi:hypothetical protein [Streptomyces sp. ITFR-6]|uniref:hypothetical protein n=1 Tax=Streptomyces sp. ITFR-6 TaxID=3075197 RepID=UPI00288B16D7|nr:hypothetical protein [Streptomyces sp. ITFR-6]WNI30144.1 hypothetical protein RLT59_16090 [Streptomyces sp. ITFR-6]
MTWHRRGGADETVFRRQELPEVERPHPGAQFRFTDLGGLRLTCSATNTGRRR